MIGPSVVLSLMLAQGAAKSAAAPAVVLARDVAPISRTGDATDPALLLVYVVDEDGVPLKDAEVALTYASGKRGTGTTAKDGTALLRSDEAGRLTVRASSAGRVPAEARNVTLKRNGLTVVALALEPLPSD